ncbi:hypothetical protein [Paenibacillus sp. IHBB 10380]|uniref:hypothetical protein n=1 Tax=Paenibacillus sp. IHBB 10380 TaxID=1566358 RepID=UPI0005CFC947|nr:hypothetical protein [Paenibacillus sp. IHBB 10380]AJS59915.1 hypothetical protein UB51_17175 [Paenibacillus sp. IHBB 10380]
MNYINYLFSNNHSRFLLAICLIVILSGCGTKQLDAIQATNTQATSTEIQDSDDAYALEGNNQKQINYLFYNEADEVNNIILSFYGNYNKRKITKIELLQGDTLVTTNVEIRDTTINNNGQFIIILPTYVAEFNRARMFDEHNDLIFTLNTGQYYLEKINLKNQSKGNEWYLDSYTTKEHINTFNMDAVLRKKGIESYKVQILVPRKLEKQNILKQKADFPIENNNMNFHYESQISLSDFEEYVTIAYDMLAIQKDNQGNQIPLMNTNIPLSITDVIE